MCKIGENRKAHVDYEFRPHFFQSTTKKYQEPPHQISFSLAKVLNLTNFGTKLSSRDAPTNLAKCKLHPIQNFRAPRISWYSFWDICRPLQPSHLKNHEFHFFTKLPTKPSSYAVVHHQPWPCAKPSELKTFTHQEFDGFHLGTFVGLSNTHIPKTTNFIFSQNSPPSNQAMPWCTDNLAMCKPLRTQNFRAPRISWYSFGDICRPFQPSHLKNYIFTQNSPQAIWQCHYAPTNLAK